MTADPFNIPTGPIHTEPLDHRPSAEQETILRSILADAGVELGAYDERILRWLAQFADWGTFAVIASWVRRAGAQTGNDLEQRRELRRLELLETSLIDYINRADTPDMVGHVLTGMLALISGQADDELPAP
jgi:hypothetical protein